MNKLVFTMLLVALGAPLASPAAERGRGSDRGRGGEGRATEGRAVGVRAILIIASKEPGPTDRRLAEYEGHLRNNLRFESFRYVSEGTATVAPGDKRSISLPQGNGVEVSNVGGSVTASRGGRGGYGLPAVFLGGSAGGKGEVYGIIVVSR